VLRIEGADDSYIANIYLQGHDLALLPALEELELAGGEDVYTHKRQTRLSKLAHEGQTRAWMAAIQPFISARRRVGRPVKVSFYP
jgi:hypothetical protein